MKNPKKLPTITAGELLQAQTQAGVFDRLIATATRHIDRIPDGSMTVISFCAQAAAHGKKMSNRNANTILNKACQEGLLKAEKCRIAGAARIELVYTPVAKATKKKS